MVRRPLWLIVGVLGVAACAAACGGGTASRTPGPGTGTAAQPSAAAAGTPGEDGFRAFAREIDDAAKAGDVAFFRERMVTTPVDCSTATAKGQIGGPVCETPDARFDGFDVGPWRSEAAIVPADDAAGAFRRLFDEQLAGERDEYGDGAAVVYALNVRDGAYMAAITALVHRPADFAGEGPLRAALSTKWEFEGGEWRMAPPLIVAYVLADDFLKPSPESGYDAWERFRRTGG